MRFFLTGATGYIGSAVLEAGLRATHQVTALVRDPEKAEHVSSRGATAVIGELSRPASYAAAAEKCDVLIHAASDAKRKQVVDREAIDTLMAAAERRVEKGLPACVIYTSGVWVLGHTQGAAKEDAPMDPPAHVSWRPEHEALVLTGSPSGRVRTAVIRPGIVYGGARGIIGDLLKDARNGLLRVVGDGRNHWPCIYDRDLADVYLRVASSRMRRESSTSTTKPTSAWTTSWTRSRGMSARASTFVMSRSAKRGRRWAPTRTPSRSIRSSEARAPRALGWSPTLHSVAGNVARLLEEFRTAVEAAA
jgi:nucleoside-diphosphate-sugar epimerase